MQRRMVQSQGEMGRPCAYLTIALFFITSAAHADTLTLQRAIAMAMRSNADVEASRASQAEADAQRDAASRAWFPRITVEEGWQRGDQPVFAFGSLLAQRRFSEADFAVESLNHPDPISNHRASLLLRQSIFDGGGIRARSDAAESTQALSGVRYRRAENDVAVGVVQAYADVLVADGSARAAAAAIRSAAEDISRAEQRHDHGMATTADVLSLKVHLAEMQARHVAAVGDGRVARARLNSLLGVAIDTSWDLEEPSPSLARANAAVTDVDLTNRPDVLEAAIRVDTADAATREARAMLLPQVGFEGGYEWNGGTWATRAGSWIVGIRAELTLSTGGVDIARARAAAGAAARARAEKTSTERAARVELLAAQARVDTARAREDIAVGAVSHARESERIIRDRYEVGLAPVADVLRAAEAVLAAESLEINAHADAVVASAMLDRARGRTPDGQP